MFRTHWEYFPADRHIPQSLVQELRQILIYSTGGKTLPSRTEYFFVTLLVSKTQSPQTGSLARTIWIDSERCLIWWMAFQVSRLHSGFRLLYTKLLLLLVPDPGPFEHSAWLVGTCNFCHRYESA